MAPLTAGAVAVGTASDDVIVNILARCREPACSEQVATSDALTLTHVPLADCARYDRLRGSHAAA